MGNSPQNPRDAYGSQYDHSTENKDGSRTHYDGRGWFGSSGNGNPIGTSTRDKSGNETFRDTKNNEIRGTHK